MSLFLPELALISMALVFFFMSLGKPKSSFLQGVALAQAAIVVFIALFAFKFSCNQPAQTMFYDAYRVDAFSQLFKIILTFGLFLVIYLGAGLKGITDNLKAEYYMFMTLSVLGLVFLSSAVELLTIVISLEISSFALYVIIPFRFQKGYRKQMEAGIKYVMFGAMATGISLYGMSYIYGMAHTTYLNELVQVLPGMLKHQPAIIIGLILMMASFFYKLAMFPMHFWAPDVYEGSSNETAGFIATLPKVGAVALLIRLVALAGIEINQITGILAIFAILSMVVGNLSALVQDDLKRLLAYSSIAHAGYVMVAILCVNTLGFSAAIYYIAGYLVMNLACFYVIYNISPKGENVTFADLKGLYKNSPMLALTLVLGAFGMAGIPPTVGFFGKFFIFTAAIEKSLYAIVILTVINAGISAFYYLKMVRAAFMTSDEESSVIQMDLSAYILGLILIVTILGIGIFPQTFMHYAEMAAGTIL
ncbi:MAG: NADH-quinone oxidoreductase subunit N [Proteobacteria bacterium]|nr:NADH-quinone oxidoreductase subunit N [Pseudomonadota bacterium]